MSKQFARFWVAFFVTAISAFVLYWIWSQKREVLPPPLFVDWEASRTARRPVEAKPTAARPPKPDQLEAIRGIGPASAQRLNEAGVFTYAQLAQLTPEEVGLVVGSSRWNPADWIAEAEKLSGLG